MSMAITRRHQGSDQKAACWRRHVEARAQIPLDSVYRRRDGSIVIGDLELLPILVMSRPFPLHLDDLTGSRGHFIADYGHQITAAVDLDRGNGIAVFVVDVCKSAQSAPAGRAVGWLTGRGGLLGL